MKTRVIKCSCGCGKIVNPGRKYINGHYWIGKKRPDVTERLTNNHHFKGKHLSDKHREKQSIALKGREFSDEHKRKLSLAAKGKTYSDEIRQKISQTLMGNIPWNKGIPMRSETKEKIRKTLTGQTRTFSKQHRERLSKSQKGKIYSIEAKCKMSKSAFKRFESPEDHPRWMGGIATSPYCPEFTTGLKEYIKYRDGGVCQNCEAVEDLVVHHINYDKKYCEHDNLITVCRSCNSKANSNRDLWEAYYKQKTLLNFK